MASIYQSKRCTAKKLKQNTKLYTFRETEVELTASTSSTTFDKLLYHYLPPEMHVLSMQHHLYQSQFPANCQADSVPLKHHLWLFHPSSMSKVT